VPFGLKSLDVIADLRRSESREVNAKKLGFPFGKLIVTCGYNASRAQQHAMMVEALSELSPGTKSQLFVLVPMTYPEDSSYRHEISGLLNSSQLEYRIMDRKLSLEDNCRLRLATDYAVNVQITDSLSASIQEHMFAGSSMIVAKWLPYSIFERMGIVLNKVNTSKDIAATIERLVVAGERGTTNSESLKRLYDYSSWSTNGERWLALYRGGQVAVDSWSRIS
jgi:hypothetical protein